MAVKTVVALKLKSVGGDCKYCLVNVKSVIVLTNVIHFHPALDSSNVLQRL